MTFGDLWGDLGGPDTISHLPGGQKESIDTKNEKIRISRIRIRIRISGSPRVALRWGGHMLPIDKISLL